MRLRLRLLRETLAVARLPARARVPAWAQGSPTAVARTADELSIVCRADRVPERIKHTPGWRCLKLEGVFDFGLVGVLLSVLAPLARARVGIFAFSTHDTDYVMIQQRDLGRALRALRSAGHRVSRSPRRARSASR